MASILRHNPVFNLSLALSDKADLLKLKSQLFGLAMGHLGNDEKNILPEPVPDPICASPACRNLIDKCELPSHVVLSGNKVYCDWSDRKSFHIICRVRAILMQKSKRWFLTLGMVGPFMRRSCSYGTETNNHCCMC